MPATWNPEAEAKLLLGILAQLKDANLKLDYKALAAYMGPDRTAEAVRQRVQKLRRDVESSAPASGYGNANGATAAAATSSPAGQKRKAGGGRKGGGKKTKKSDEKKKTEEETAEEEAEKAEE